VRGGAADAAIHRKFTQCEKMAHTLGLPLVRMIDGTGGGGSVRGYQYQTVGPHYPDNVPVGGLSLVEASAEFRRRITGDLGGVIFLDTGSVSERTAPDFRHTLSSVGVGLRYNLGFAPLRADLAFPLEKANGASQQAFQVYLSIGQSF